MKPAIRVKSLSKRYCIGSRRNQDNYQTLREAITSFAAGSWGGFRRLCRADQSSSIASAGRKDHIYALRDVDLDVQPGEVVGIIGHNGAGKSTLLKVLSRITEPSAGRVEMRGRIASLLEVGTGFHQELTGRENIYLNGSILGMSRKEIERKFDAIVSFSEIEQFLDTPVKRYSSGMYVRLAFAVAAHLETEILIVDEVLAVGDVGFQSKCMGKMQDVGRQGRTVLFVSHNMSALQNLCQRGILLERGRVTVDAPVEDAVREYLKALERSAAQDLSERTDRTGGGATRLTGIEMGDAEHAGTPVTLGRPARIAFRLNRCLPGLSCRFTIIDQNGNSLAKFNSMLRSRQDVSSNGDSCIECRIEEWLLAPGRYRIDVTIYVGSEVQDQFEAAALFDVERGPLRGREPPRSSHDWRVAMPHQWVVPQ